MKYVAYYRVSTQKQGQSGLGLESQVEQVKAFVKSDTIIAEFTEVESGKKSDRIELAKAVQLCRVTGAKLVIAKLDRLARNVLFVATLMESGIKFVACDCPDANEFTIHVLASVAQNEAKAASFRTASALGSIKNRIREHGSHISKLGNLITSFGTPSNLTDSAREKAAIVNRAKAAQNINNRTAAAFASELRTNGMTLQTICDKLNSNGYVTPRGNDWTPIGVSRILSRI